VRKFLFAPIFFIALLTALFFMTLLTAAPARAQIISRQPSSGPGLPCGADTQIQFNNAGVCGADPNLTWNTGTQEFIVGSLTPGNASIDLRSSGDSMFFTSGPTGSNELALTPTLAQLNANEPGTGSATVSADQAATLTSLNLNVILSAPNGAINQSGVTLTALMNAGISLNSDLSGGAAGITLDSSSGSGSITLNAGAGNSLVIHSLELNFASGGPELDIGGVGNTGVLGLKGATSGTATITGPSVAGTPSNPFVFSNAISVPSCTGCGGSVTNIATASPITGGPITTTGTIGCPTCNTSASTLTANQIVMGGGTRALTTLGSLGTTTTVLHGNASGLPAFASVSLSTDVAGQLPIAAVGSAGLSGTSPITISAAGAIGCTACLTSTTGANTALSNLASVAINIPLLAPVGAVGTPSYAFTTDTNTGWFDLANHQPVMTIGGVGSMRLNGQSQAFFSSSAQVGWAAGADVSTNNFDTGFCRPSTGLIAITTTPGSCVPAGSFEAAVYLTASNCANGASPAVCGSAAAGSVAIPAAGTSLTVNTTAVTANSQIVIQQDDSLGTRLGITCNSGILAGPTAITARTPGTSFTISVTTGLTINPVCLSYHILN
jgi:hypothetical protein